jgi:hypothetical protein
VGETTFVLDRAPRAALRVFLAVQVAAAFLYLWAGRNRWFFGDEWSFLISRDAGSFSGLFEPHAEHWTTLPIITYRVMFHVFGLRTYVPYQLLTITLHLLAAGLLRTVMRRAGVSPWMATVTASLFVLFGSGDSNILRAFQITFDGALVFGLVQLLLADHDGPANRRDGIGLGAGLAALMCSGVGVAMVGAVGASTLLRRGWRIAILHTSPLFAVYGLWWWTFARDDYKRLRTTPSMIVSFVGAAFSSTLSALGQMRGLGLLLGVVLVAGLLLAWRHPTSGDVRRRAAMPAGLLVGVVAFVVLTAWSRAAFGSAYAEQSRYLHIVAALLLPAIGVAADAISRRAPALVPAVVVILLVGVPGNLDIVVNHKGPGRGTRPDRELYLAAARVPIAAELPDWVRPDPTLTPDLTLGWLRAGIASGRIPDPGPIDSALEQAVTFRLVLQQTDQPAPFVGCERLTSPKKVDLASGDTIGFRGNIVVTEPSMSVDPRARLEFSSGGGETLEAAGPDSLAIVVKPDAAASAPTIGPAQLCSPRPQ